MSLSRRELRGCSRAPLHARNFAQRMLGQVESSARGLRRCTLPHPALHHDRRSAGAAPDPPADRPLERPAMTSPKNDMSVQYIHNVYSMDKSKLAAKPAAARASAEKDAAVTKAAKPRKTSPLK